MKRVAVVGAGIIGMTSALELASRGAEVTVFDRIGPAAGASGAANGALTPHSDHSIQPSVVALTLDSTRRYPDHLDRLAELGGLTVDQDRTGVLEVFLNDDDVAQGQREFADIQANGASVSWLGSSDALALEPHINPVVQAATLYEEESAIDVVQLMAATVAAATAIGVHIEAGVNMREVEPLSSSAVRLHAADTAYDFDAVVIAVGYGSCHVRNMPAVPIRTIRGELLEVKLEPGVIRRCLYRGDGFITPRRDGRLILGTNYEEVVRTDDDDPESVSVNNALKTLAANVEILPVLRTGELRRVWKGWRPTSPDDMPIIGPYGSGNVVLALGFGGLGFTAAVSAADAIADYVFNGKADNSFRPFRPDRLL